MTKYQSKLKDSKEMLFFNEAVEYFHRFERKDLIFNQNAENLNPNQLRDQMLEELNKLRDIIANHPDIKLEKLSDEEKSHYSRFIKFYSACPICGELNHYHNLKKLFFDDDNENIKEKLILFMNLGEKYSKKLKTFNIDIGIPCCKCFKELFDEDLG
ncbi:MAG: hypothetical protein EU539_06430 [Promethearchaeota archaeon]|nr:MAG: hypothetical protein EU539_06430 [Candidatus Lokiarchaeota archaeon]